MSGKEEVEVIKCKIVVKESCEPSYLRVQETIIGFQKSPSIGYSSCGPQLVETKEGPQYFIQKVSPNFDKFELNYHGKPVEEFYGPEIGSKNTGC